MSLNRREMLRLGAAGAGGLLLSSAARVERHSRARCCARPLAPDRRRSAGRAGPVAPAGINPALFARAKAALDSHGGADPPPRRHRHRRFLAWTAASRASTSSTCSAARSKAMPSRTAAGRTPTIRASRAFLQPVRRRTRRSNGTYITADTYQGKYGLSMKVAGPRLDQQQCRDRARSSSTTPGMPSPT